MDKGDSAHKPTATLQHTCRSLPISVQPSTGRLGPAGSQGSSTDLHVVLTPTESGAVVGELAISTAGVSGEPLICPVGASVVQSSYQLLDTSTKAALTEVRQLGVCNSPCYGCINMSTPAQKSRSHLIARVYCLWPATRASVSKMQVNFGELYFGESATRCLTLVNNGPTEAQWDTMAGSVSDLTALLDAGPDEASNAPGDRLAAFMQVARIRVSNCSTRSATGCSWHGAYHSSLAKGGFWRDTQKSPAPQLSLMHAAVVCAVSWLPGQGAGGQGHDAQRDASVRGDRTLRQHAAEDHVQAVCTRRR